jgi:hypothetical protein
MQKKCFSSKALNRCKNCFFDVTKMCKAHFHPFAAIISPFHAMGVKIYPQNLLIFLKWGAPTPWVPKQGACPCENTASPFVIFVMVVC